MFEEKTTKTEKTESKEIVIKYYKCWHCGAVRSELEWNEKSDFEKGLCNCPVCNGSNDPCSDEAPILVVAPFTKKDLDELDKIKKEKSELEKKEKKLAPKVKNFLTDNDISDFVFEGHRMLIGFQDRGTIDDDKLVALIREVLSQEEIESRNALKYTSNPDVVKDLISEGKITMEQFAACKIPNIISVFNLNPKPRKEKSAVDAFGGGF